MSSELRGLIDRLNAICKVCLEGSAKRAVGQGNRSIELEHFLMELLGVGDTDLRGILVNHSVDTGVVQSELTAVIERFPKDASRTPTISTDLITVLRKAWMLSSVEHKLTQIRSGTILRALLEDTALSDAMASNVPSFASLDPHAVAVDLPKLLDYTLEAEADTPVNTEPSLNATAEPVRGETFVEKYTLDLTGEAHAGRLDPVVGRENEIAQATDVLMRRRQNNPILLGEPGVGKTAVVEGLARRIAGGDVPEALRLTRLLSLDLGQMKAGTGVRGEFEKRLKGLVNEITHSPTPTVLFVDEAHTLIGAGGSEGQGDAANLLKPALARGELRMIGATTWREYKRYIEKDPALSRRFQSVKVDEPSIDDAVAMLRGIAETLEGHHDVRIEEAAVSAAVTLSARYIPARYLPDKAISVLDTACSRVAMSRGANPESLNSIIRADRVSQTERDRLIRESRLGQRHDGRLHSLTTELERLSSERELMGLQAEKEKTLIDALRVLEKLTAHRDLTAVETRRWDDLSAEFEDVQREQGLRRTHVDVNTVAEVIATWTGIPIDRLMRGTFDAVNDLEAELEKRVVGQTIATKQIAKSLMVAAARLSEPGRPMGVFLLAGPTGVGKSETARALADLMFGGSANMVLINMSEYQEPHSISGLKGAPPGYVGYGTGGVLTEAVRRTPYNIVLLDEFEKAHPDVWELFFQIFDAGTLEDSEGEKVDFSNTIILATTNIGDEAIMNTVYGEGADLNTLMERLNAKLAETFHAALMGRMVAVPYLPLDEEEIKKIVDLRLSRLTKQVLEAYNAEFRMSSAAREHIVALSFTTGGAGAREINRVVEGQVLPAVAHSVLDIMGEGKEIFSIEVDLADNQFKVDVKQRIE